MRVHQRPQPAGGPARGHTPGAPLPRWYEFAANRRALILALVESPDGSNVDVLVSYRYKVARLPRPPSPTPPCARNATEYDANEYAALPVNHCILHLMNHLQRPHSYCLVSPLSHKPFRLADARCGPTSLGLWNTCAVRVSNSLKTTPEETAQHSTGATLAALRNLYNRFLSQLHHCLSTGQI